MFPFPWRVTDRAPVTRVAPLEIFFDVVFVFTLTQLSHVLEDDLSVAGVGRILLIFGILWWMFTGFVWVPNHVPPRQVPQKVLLVTAMFGFLLAAIAIPHAFEGAGVLFGAGYALVICVHLLLFTQAGIGRGLVWLAPYNLGCALLVLCGGFAGGGVQWVLWSAGLAVQAILPYLVPRFSWVGAAGAYRIAAEHFVERHGLLVIVALGESVVAIGMGVDGENLTAGTVAVVALALALPACLWAAYFAETEAATAALVAVADGPRARLAIRLGFAHVPVMLGIVFTAAGIHTAVAHPGAPVPWASAATLSGGVAACLLGIAEIRHARHDKPFLSAVLYSVAALALVAVGVRVSIGWQLAGLVILLGVMLSGSARRRPEPTGRRPDEDQDSPAVSRDDDSYAGGKRPDESSARSCCRRAHSAQRTKAADEHLCTAGASGSEERRG